MQSDRDLLKQALEALESVREQNMGPLIHPAKTALRERLAQPEQDWDWRHPKAQALIGAKARLEIKLRLVEQLVEDPYFETTASDMEYWEPLHDKLQERLAQPEQEPVGEIVQAFADLTAVSIPVMPPIGTKLYTTPQPNTIANSEAIPEQIAEPVAWRNKETGEFCTGGFLRKDWARWTPLYTTPPRRGWVGLTKEEAKEISLANRPYVVDMIAALEARLKEKNNG